MHEITLPKLNNNDETYVLVEWLAGDGQELAPDSPVAMVETSKAIEELVAEAGGVLQQVVEVNTECAIGAVIGRLFPTRQARLEYIAAASRAGSSGDGGTPAEDVIITRSAREAAEELGVDIARLSALGKKVLRRRDVEEFASRAPAGETRPASEAAPAGSAGVRLSAAQQAVGQVVTRSHQDIPAAFLAVKVPVDAALELQGRLAGSQIIVGLPELLVRAVAGLRELFPLFFGCYQPGGNVSLAPGANVGITMDLGKGLYIPVVGNADNKSLAEIADIMADFRISALRGAFLERELAGGNITISLSNDADIVLAWPIIFPGQTCMLCLHATQEELFLDAQGDIATRRYVNLGITYDHRVVNGREATLFLQEIKKVLAKPDGLST
jgi:2-oxoglutarate dehydrogenase E2 component (dihydrolipoamide succinyltransferase)